LRAKSVLTGGVHYIFADWETSRVGFMEMDLVSHEGGNPRGQFAFTLTLTDVCSGLTENKAVKNRAQK